MWLACVGVCQLLNWKMHGETLKKGGEVIRSAKYSDYIVVLAKDNAVLQRMTNRHSWGKLWNGNKYKKIKNKKISR